MMTQWTISIAHAELYVWDCLLQLWATRRSECCIGTRNVTPAFRFPFYIRQGGCSIYQPYTIYYNINPRRTRLENSQWHLLNKPKLYEWAGSLWVRVLRLNIQIDRSNTICLMTRHHTLTQGIGLQMTFSYIINLGDCEVCIKATETQTRWWKNLFCIFKTYLFKP